MSEETKVLTTDAEAHFDRLVDQRRRQGRKTYGRGLTHTDEYDWTRMALEEALDLGQYLAAENLRLREQLAATGQPAPAVLWGDWPPEARENICAVLRDYRRNLIRRREELADLPRAMREMNATARALAALEDAIHPDKPWRDGDS